MYAIIGMAEYESEDSDIDTSEESQKIIGHQKDKSKRILE